MTWTGGCLCGGHYGVESRISWLKIEDDLKKERTQLDV